MDDKTKVFEIGIPIEAPGIPAVSDRLALEVYADKQASMIKGKELASKSIVNQLQLTPKAVEDLESFLIKPNLTVRTIGAAGSSGASPADRSEKLVDASEQKTSQVEFQCYFTPFETGPSVPGRQELKRKLDFFYEPTSMGTAFQGQNLYAKAAWTVGNGVALKTFYDRPNLLATAALIPASQLVDDFYSLQAAGDSGEKLKYSLATTADAFALTGSAMHFGQKVPALKQALSKTGPYGKTALVAGIVLKVASSATELKSTNETRAEADLRAPFQIDFSRLTPKAPPAGPDQDSPERNKAPRF